MILYFSATGNTQYVAQRIADVTKDKIISIRECMRKANPSFHLAKDENFGIVMPTYFQGMPLFLQEFVEKLSVTMDGTDHYVYTVSTYGVSYGNSGSEAIDAAAKAGISVDATFGVSMVDNWNPYFDMTDENYIREAEQRAEADIERVCIGILEKKKQYLPDSFDHKQAEEQAESYEESRKTQLFKVNDDCIGCGVCAGQCPVKAIEIQEKKPVWIQEKCLLCLGCVHKCPTNAIAYTDDTIGHGQYINPHISEVL